VEDPALAGVSGAAVRELREIVDAIHLSTVYWNAHRPPAETCMTYPG
jgi:hypothetical protein